MGNVELRTRDPIEPSKANPYESEAKCAHTAFIAPRGRLIPANSLDLQTSLPSQSTPSQRTAPMVIAPALALVSAAVIAYCFTEVNKAAPPTLITAESDSIDRLAFQYALPAFRERVQQFALSQQPILAPDVAVSQLAQPVSHVVQRAAQTQQPSSQQLAKKVLEVIQKYAPKRKDAAGLAAAIVAESELQDFDPLFVAAVIKSESTFNALARSNKGAQGLMQIMPKTGAWLADKQEIPRGHLTDPGYNLKLGVSYLKHLEQMYDGDRVFVLIAYNWGPGRVDSATDGKRRVPPEVVTYAVKIMNDYRRWQSTV
jgi:soluble lytic murein transglycosylase-like protein